MTEELSFGLAMFKEKIAEPDLGEMGLILICRIYLFYCIEGFSFEMETLPNLGKTSTSKLLPS